MEPGGQEDQDQAHQAARQVKGHPAPSGDTAGHQVPNKEEQQPHRHHEGQVLEQAGKTPLDQVFRALLRQGILLLQPCDHACTSSLATFHWAAVW